MLPAARALAEMDPTASERRRMRALLARQLATYSANTRFREWSDVEPLAELLADLCQTLDELNETRTELLQTVPTTWMAIHFMKAFMRMEPTDAERLRVAAVLVQELSKTGNHSNSSLVESLLTLSSAEAVRVQVLSWLLPILERAHPSSVVTLTDLLLTLRPDLDEASAVKAALAKHMPWATSRDAHQLMEAFLALMPTQEERLTAGQANLDRVGDGWEPLKDIDTLLRNARSLLPITDWLAWVNCEATVESTVAMLASDSSNGDSPHSAAILKLAASSDELRRRALNRVMVLLPSTRTHGIVHLAAVASDLGASREQLGQIVERLVEVVGSTESDMDAQIGGALTELITSSDNSDNLRSRAVHRLLAIMPSAGTKSSRQLVRALSVLVESSGELRDAAVNGLPWAHLAVTSCLQMAFSGLGMSAEQRERAVDGVLDQLPSIGPGDAYTVVRSLADAGMSERQMECLVELVLGVVSTAAPWLGSMIVNEMPKAGASAEQRARLAHKLLDRVQDLGPTYHEPVFRTLKHLAETAVWQRWVQDHGLSVEEAGAV
ncbi:MAG TPA: hypothetical protein DEG43_07485 [Acidimicrobiaceae bacterium]|nr:hypothetical protein [Acidimicrobiaceae bacterium]